MLDDARPLVSVDNLRVEFRGEDGPIVGVEDVSFSIGRGETVCVVGESGSGKSVTSLSLMRLVEFGGGRIVGGRIEFEGARGVIDVSAAGPEAMRAIRGVEIGMIFQEPMTSLNPVFTIERQMTDGLRLHRGLSVGAARARALELLKQVRIPEPERRLRQYPHELSGGMRQRVVIAMAMACEPRLLIADEPTTALDVTVQAQILELLRELQDRTGMAMLFITHNFGVVAEIADRTMVMHSGRVVEEGDVAEVLERPLMPYTSGLMRSVPRLEMAGLHDATLATIEGFVPDPAQMPSGCAFHPRCPHASPGLCDAETPPLEAASEGHRLRCRRWRDLEGTEIW